MGSKVVATPTSGIFIKLEHNEKDNLAISKAFSRYGQKTTDKPHPQLQNNRERNLIVKN